MLCLHAVLLMTEERIGQGGAHRVPLRLHDTQGSDGNHPLLPATIATARATHNSYIIITNLRNNIATYPPLQAVRWDGPVVWPRVQSVTLMTRHRNPVYARTPSLLYTA